MSLTALLVERQDSTLFRLALNRLRDTTLPITRFVSALDRKSEWTSAEIRAFFGFESPEPHRRIAEITALIPDYGKFLDKHGFHPERDAVIDPAEFVHDTIGHMALGYPVTPRGEVMACAGVAGFSSKIGIDYFINALLMFCLGYRLFDDVPSALVPLDSTNLQKIDTAYEAGMELANCVSYSDQGKALALNFIVQAWPRIRQFKASLLP